MEQTIRSNTFETNSSSEHSLSLIGGNQIWSIMSKLDDKLEEAESKEDFYTALGYVKALEELIMENIKSLEG